MSSTFDNFEKFFKYEHLSEEYQEISKPFCELARHVDLILPHNPEKTVMFRKLLEAKDCAVRSHIQGYVSNR